MRPWAAGRGGASRGGKRPLVVVVAVRCVVLCCAVLCWHLTLRFLEQNLSTLLIHICSFFLRSLTVSCSLVSADTRTVSVVVAFE